MSAAGTSVYVAAGDGYLYALDARTGRPRWQREIGILTPSQAPLVYRGLVYAGSPDSFVYAVDATSGDIQWKNGIGSTNVTTGALFAVAQGQLFAQGDSKSYAISLDSGRVIQSYNMQALPGPSGVACVQTQDGQYPALAAYDMMGGKTVWGFATPGAQSGPATMANHTLYLGVVNMNVSECCTVTGGLTAGKHENWVSDVIAVSATEGKYAWSSRSIPEGYLSAATVVGNNVYVIGAYSLYALNALNAQTGKIRWVWVDTEPLATTTLTVAVA